VGGGGVGLLVGGVSEMSVNDDKIVDAYRLWMAGGSMRAKSAALVHAASELFEAWQEGKQLKENLKGVQELIRAHDALVRQHFDLRAKHEEVCARLARVKASMDYQQGEGNG
jgi:hypothetical protein